MSEFLNNVRDIMRKKHYSIHTENAYTDWIKRFIIYHGKRHPKEMGESEISQFLTLLARDLNVVASTQTQTQNIAPLMGICVCTRNAYPKLTCR